MGKILKDSKGKLPMRPGMVTGTPKGKPNKLGFLTKKVGRVKSK